MQPKTAAQQQPIMRRLKLRHKMHFRSEKLGLLKHIFHLVTESGLLPNCLGSQSPPRQRGARAARAACSANAFECAWTRPKRVCQARRSGRHPGNATRNASRAESPRMQLTSGHLHKGTSLKCPTWSQRCHELKLDGIQAVLGWRQGLGQAPRDGRKNLQGRTVDASWIQC